MKYLHYQNKIVHLFQCVQELKHTKIIVNRHLSKENIVVNSNIMKTIRNIPLLSSPKTEFISNPELSSSSKKIVLNQEENLKLNYNFLFQY